MKTFNLTVLFCIMSLFSVTLSTAADARDMVMKQCMPMSNAGDADTDFIRDMIPHHQMALEMAEKELKNGRDPAAREMAQKIIVAQKREISTMKKWLNTHKP